MSCVYDLLRKGVLIMYITCNFVLTFYDIFLEI